MKFLKKATLAAAVAVAPFAAQAELKAMDDAMMSATTGQAGVTIEIDIEGAGVSIGEVEYTDTGSGTTGGGSAVLQNININNVTGLTQTIDINEEGDLLITQSGVNDMALTLGDVDGVADNQYSAVALKGTNGTAELVDSLSLQMDLGDSDITIHNLANGAALSSVGVTGAQAANTSSVAIEMTSAIKIDRLDAQIFGYTEAQAVLNNNITLGANQTLGQYTAAAGAAVTTTTTAYTNAQTALANDAGVGDVDYNSDGTVQTVYAADGVTVLDLNDAANSAIAGLAGAVDTADSTRDTAVSNSAIAQRAVAQADGGAVTISNLTFDNDGAAATIEQTIWAAGDGVYIQMGQIQGDLTIGSIGIGSNAQGQPLSIGSVAVRDINLSGLTQRISGHD